MGLDLIQVCTGKISAGLDSGYGRSMQGNSNMIEKLQITFYSAYALWRKLTDLWKLEVSSLKKGPWNNKK